MALNKSPYRGTRDFFPTQMRLRNYIFQKMAEISERFAYEPCDGPLLEEVELYLAKSGEELINEQIYSFTDRGDRKVAIRPEMTPTVARMASQVHREIPKPIRWYSIPNLMRYEKPQRGRLREFWQYNADIFGAGELGELEIIQLSILLLKEFGASSSHFEVLLNDRRFVDLVFKCLIGLEQEDTKKLYKLIDAKNKMPAEKFSQEVRKITSDENKVSLFEEFVALKSVDNIRDFVSKYQSNIKSENFSLEDNVQPLLNLLERLSGIGLNEFVKFDPSIVRGLDYYTGMVFEIYDKHPENRRAIAGGGSYANLLQIFNEPPLEGVGIGLGEVPLTDFLTSHGLAPDFSKSKVDFLIAYLVPEGEKVAFDMANKLRSLGKSVEVSLGATKPKKVFTYSEKKNFSYICFLGDEEINKNEVKVKDLKSRTEKNYSISSFIQGLI